MQGDSSTEDGTVEIDSSLQQTLEEPGSRTVSDKEVRESTGAARAQWTLAAETELEGSFYDMGAVTETTPEELQQVGGQRGVLPMTAVWVQKHGGLAKCRGCVCGNFQQKDPCEQVWTAQAETSSVMSGMRFAQMKGWGSTQIRR